MHGSVSLVISTPVSTLVTPRDIIIILIFAPFSPRTAIGTGAIFSGVLRTPCLPDVSVDCSVDNSGVLLLYHDNLRRLAVILPEWLSATGGSTLVIVRHEQVGY